MHADIGLWITGSVLLWILSAGLAMALALLIAAGTNSSWRAIRLAAAAGMHLTRGVPTGLLVIIFGLGCMRIPAAPALPVVFPGTSQQFQLVAWGIVVALGLGSSGHIAVIYLTAWHSAGIRRLDQARVMGLSPYLQVRVVGREVLPLVLGPLGARLVHHLHNTGFAALFPVVELFGGVVEASNETFAVARFAAVGAVIYIVLSQAIWGTTRALERRLRAPTRDGQLPSIPEVATLP
ncbi:MAG: hypothetical protein ACRDTF_06365 [Pseudonocardiaceae bacterium]